LPSLAVIWPTAQVLLTPLHNLALSSLQVNWYFLCPEFGVHKDVTKLVTAMCIIGGSMGMLTKLPWPVWLGADVAMLDGLAKVLPDFYSFSTAGTPETCMFESMCGPKVRAA
jgi:hypothetical protein